MNKILEPPYDRSKYAEGRSTGLAFTFLKKTAKGYLPLHPFSTCKDYLNDLVFVERTKKPLGLKYGFKHEFINYIYGQSKIYLGVKCVGNKSGGAWSQQKEAEEMLIENYFVLESNLNEMERQLGARKLTTVEVVDDTLVLNLSKMWAKNGPTISFFTLFIRTMFNFEGDLSVGAVEKHTPFIAADAPMFKNIVSCLGLGPLFYKEVAKFTYANSTPGYIHNYGISAWVKEYHDKIIKAELEKKRIAEEKEKEKERIKTEKLFKKLKKSPGFRKYKPILDWGTAAGVPTAVEATEAPDMDTTPF